MTTPQPKRAVLFIAHTFPPAGGSGSYRAAAFARYLPRNGWRPILLTPETAWAASRDERLLAELPSDLTVIRTRSWERPPGPPPAAGAITAISGSRPPKRSLLTKLKSQVAHLQRFPDAHVGWTWFAVRAGLKAIREERVTAIYSTAAPFTNHLVAYILHKLTKLPWLLELRDGWYEWNFAIFPDYPRWRHWLERPLERAAITSASKAILVTELMAEKFRRQFPNLPADHFVTLPNGFDPREVMSVQPDERDDDHFQVLYAGSLYYGRSIDAFLEAAARLAAEDPEFGQQFRLKIVGSMDQTARAEITHHLQRQGLGAESIEYAGYLNHWSTLAAMSAADLLLVLVNTTPGAEATVPGKLFEYLAVARPILAVLPRGAEAADIVKRTRSGWSAQAGDVDSILSRLRMAYHAFRMRQLPVPEEAEVARYDRREQAKELARLLDDLVR